MNLRRRALENAGLEELWRVATRPEHGRGFAFTSCLIFSPGSGTHSPLPVLVAMEECGWVVPWSQG